MAGVGTLQLVDEDLLTVRFDLNLDTGVGNPGGLKTVAREFRPRIPELQAVRFEPRGFPGGRTTFVRDPLTVMAWSQAILGTTNNTFDELSVGAGELTRLLRAGGVLKWLPTGSAEARFYDFEPSDGAPLLGDEPEDLFRALTSFAYPAGIPISVLRQPYRRLAELDPSVNVLANSTLLIDRNGNGEPDGWLTNATPVSASISAADEAYKVTTDAGGEGIYQGDILVAAGEVWTASVYLSVVSGSGRVALEFYDSAGGATGFINGPTITSSAWARTSVTATVPANTVKGVITLYSVAASSSLLWRLAQLEKASAASRFRCSAQALSNDPTVAGQGRMLPVWVEGDAPCPVKFKLSMGTNQMTKNQSDIETDTTGWNAGANTTIARTTAQAQQGVASLSLTATGAGDILAHSLAGTAGRPVTSGRRYTASIFFRAAATARNVRVAIEFWKADGSAAVGAIVGLQVLDSTTGWTRATVSATAPGDAVFANPTAIVLAAAASEVHYIDASQLQPGPVASAWEAGESATTAEVLYASRLSHGVLGKLRLADLLNRHHFRAAAATALGELGVSVTDATAVGGAGLDLRYRRQHQLANGNSTGPSVTWPLTTKAGSTLLAFLYVDYAGTSTTITDPAGWTVVSSSVAGTVQAIKSYKIENASARSGAETWTLGAAKAWGVVIVEVQAGGVVDVAAFVKDDTGVQPAESGSAATTQADDYLFAFLAARIGSGNTFVNPTGSFVEVQQTSANVAIGGFERIVTATGSYQCTASVDPQTVPDAGAIIAVKIEPGAAVSSLQRLFRQEISTALDALRGSFTVYLRLKPAGKDEWEFTLKWTASLGIAESALAPVKRDFRNAPTFGKWAEIPLGSITVPEAGALAGVALEVWGKRTATSVAASDVTSPSPLRLDSLFLVPADDTQTILLAGQGDAETWLGSELATPVASPAGGTAGVVSGTELLLNAAANNAGTPPNVGAVWPAGVNVFTFKLRNSSAVNDGLITLRIRNVTDGTTLVEQAGITVPKATVGGGLLTVNMPAVLAAGKLYQAQVDDPGGAIGSLYVQSIGRVFSPILVSGEAMLAEADGPSVDAVDSSGNLLRSLAVQGPVPDLLEPGLNLLHVALLDPAAAGFEEGESVLSRTGTLSVTHAPRFFE